MKSKTWVLVLTMGLFILFLAGVALFPAWNGGMTVGLMGNAEQALITNVRFVEGAPAGDTAKITVRNTGSTSVSISQGYANGTKATNINSGQAFVIPKATSLEITLTFPIGTLVYGNEQTLKLVSVKGNTMVYSLRYNSTNTSEYNPRVDDISPTPRPLQASELTPPMKLSSSQALALCVTSAIAAIASVGACLLANSVLHPRNKKELCVLLFFVTLVVVFAIVAVVFQIVFPPQIGLMVTLFQR